MDTPILIGIDLGTHGVRAVAATDEGRVVARAAADLDSSAVQRVDAVHEQLPEAWWIAVCKATGDLSAQLDALGISGQATQGVAVDGTSGTIVPISAAGQPLRPALMYNDRRAVDEAESLNQVGAANCESLGYRFDASFGLAKILWLKRHEPGVFESAHRFLHQADYIAARLTGRFDVSDASNALKTGYDLAADRWPDWIGSIGGVAERLPHVVPCATAIGEISETAAQATRLPPRARVIAAATDGTAGAIASGIRRAGDYNTTLGTTLVFKGVSPKLCRHVEGLIYCHKLADDWWLPGAASNTGGEWIEARYRGADLAELDADAADRFPTGMVAYPLVRTGERFPFVARDAVGFFLHGPHTSKEHYAACLEGVALVERLAYRVLDEATSAADGEIYATGGGARSEVWLQCRADVTGRLYHRSAVHESAFGAAVLAAAATVHDGLRAAVERMVRVERTFYPRELHRSAYDEMFGRFCQELARRGYASF